MHKKLLSKSSHYRAWHAQPYHQHHHGLVFVLAFLIAASAVAGVWGQAINEQDLLVSQSFGVRIAQAQATIPAFPGCEGFGCDTPGGRGGRVIAVTNLNDSGPGSLRDALLQTGPRIVVFEVSGTINLNSYLTLRSDNSYVTVAGQTAPGDGIAIEGAPMWLEGLHDAVFQHVRFR